MVPEVQIVLETRDAQWMRKVNGQFCVLREDKITVAVYKQTRQLYENLSTTLLYAFDLKISDGISTATSTR